MHFENQKFFLGEIFHTWLVTFKSKLELQNYSYTFLPIFQSTWWWEYLDISLMFSAQRESYVQNAKVKNKNTP